jgi:hypothetical protein
LRKSLASLAAAAIPLGSQQEMNPQTGNFRTHQHYLEAFAHIAADGHSLSDDAYIAIKSRFEQNRIQIKIPEETTNRDQLRRALENAWSTELLLLMSRRVIKEDEIVRLSNNWNVIQGYYAVYHATQALIIGRGMKRPETHPKTQKMFVDFWSRLPIEYAPWSLVMGVNGCSIKGISIDPSIHQWTSVNSETCWSIACKAIRTTRNDALIERKKVAREEKRKALRKKWQEKNAGKNPNLEPPAFPLPQLTAEKKAEIDRDTRCYSLMDYLYRLRIRCNYVDSSMFVDGPEMPSDSTGVRVALIKIVSTTIFATEILLCSTKDGRVLLNGWAKEWVKRSVPQEMRFGVGARINLWY